MMECTLIAGQKRLEWAGVVLPYSIDIPALHTSQVTCNQVRSEEA
jgi:hypothetical protein